MTTAATISARLIIDKTDYDRGIASASQQAALLGSKLSGVMTTAGKGLRSIGTGLTLGVTVPLALASKELISTGNAIAGVEEGFSNFTSQAGIDANQMLSSLKATSDGLISNTDLMKSFGQAAGLVGVEFAETLPDSLGLFNKVAAATSQDASKVLNDYVTGIGRGSKMILDNLGITVDLVAANDAYALSVGKSAADLTDQEQKLALNAQAMGLLIEKYAGMSDASDISGAGMKQFAVQLANLKDQFSLFLVGALDPLLGRFAILAAEWGPKINAFLDSLSPKMQTVILVVAALTAVLGPIMVIFGFLLSTLGGLIPVITAVVGAISGPLIIALAAIAAVIAVISAGIALFVLGWKNNWGGIRDAVLDAWAVISVHLAELKAYLDIHIPMAIEVLKGYWENVLLPVMERVFTWISEILIPILTEMVVWLIDKIPVALTWLANVWETVLLPAITTVWEWISTILMPLLSDLWNWLQENLPTALAKLAIFWEETLLPAITKVWTFLDTYVFPLIKALATFIGGYWVAVLKVLGWVFENVVMPRITEFWDAMETLVFPIIKDIAAWLNEKLSPAFEWLGTAIQNVTAFLGDLGTSLMDLEIPEWLTPGSPTPLEMGIRGISRAIKDLSSDHMPELATSLALNGTGSFGSGLSSGGGSSVVFEDGAIRISDQQTGENLVSWLTALMQEGKDLNYG